VNRLKYTIRQATTDGDLDAMLQLRVEAETWMRQAGIRQWTSDYSDYARGVLRESVEQRVAWIVESDRGEIAGTVTLNGPDMDFWQPADDPDSALYLIKMIVTRAHAGRGLGDAIINWASVRALAAGKTWLRLDCRRDNTRLHDYYRQRGFEHVRTVWPPPRRTESGALFQRAAGIEIDPPMRLADRAYLQEVDPERPEQRE
jgi:GNAT superfamily N-acetyltransferase